MADRVQNTQMEDFILPCECRIMCVEGVSCVAHLADGRVFACHVKTLDDYKNLEYKCDCTPRPS